MRLFCIILIGFLIVVFTSALFTGLASFEEPVVVTVSCEWIASMLDAADSLWKHKKRHHALVVLSEVVQNVNIKHCHNENSSILQVYDSLGDMYDVLGDNEQSLLNHHRALNLTLSAGKVPWGVVARYAAVAIDYQKLRQYKQSRNLLATALHLPFMLQPAKSMDEQTMRKTSASLLLRIDSNVCDCQGDPITALQLLEQSIKINEDRDVMDPSNPFLSLRTRLDYLKKIIEISQFKEIYREMTEEGLPPVKVSTAMQQSIQSIIYYLLDNGPWKLSNQLPQAYVPKLTALPFHTSTTSPAISYAIQPLLALLQTKNIVADLRKEYYHLRSEGFMKDETECIHDARRESNRERGRWTRFSVNKDSIHNVIRDSNNCAPSITPTTCVVLDLLIKTKLLDSNEPISILRADFSAIEGNTWLRPHFGRTNGQLKIHLGLVIPMRNNKECSFLRVGNEIKAWKEGESLVFDDSFEHEAWNSCEELRVVFQVVILHPDLRDRMKNDKKAVLPLSSH